MPPPPERRFYTTLQKEMCYLHAQGFSSHPWKWSKSTETIWPIDLSVTDQSFYNNTVSYTKALPGSGKSFNEGVSNWTDKPLVLDATVTGQQHNQFDVLSSGEYKAILIEDYSIESPRFLDKFLGQPYSIYLTFALYHIKGNTFDDMERNTFSFTLDVGKAMEHASGIISRFFFIEDTMHYFARVTGIFKGKGAIRFTVRWNEFWSKGEPETLDFGRSLDVEQVVDAVQVSVPTRDEGYSEEEVPTNPPESVVRSTESICMVSLDEDSDNTLPYNM